MPTAYGSIGVQRGAALGGSPSGASLQAVYAQPVHATQRAATVRGAHTLVIPLGPANLNVTRRGGQSVLNTSLLGTTSVSAVVTGGRRVFVYDHDTGRLLANVISDASGNFAVYGLPVATAKYHFVMRQIASDAGSFNAARFDRVTQT